MPARFGPKTGGREIGSDWPVNARHNGGFVFFTTKDENRFGPIGTAQRAELLTERFIGALAVVVFEGNGLGNDRGI